MDPDGQAVLAFLEAIQSAQDTLKRLTWDDKRVEPLMPVMPNGTRRPLVAGGQVRFSGLGGLASGGKSGEVVISAYVNLRKVEAFYGDDRVEDLEWRISLSWSGQAFLIDTRIVAYTTCKYQNETDLLHFPDRSSSTLEECLYQLAQVASELAEERAIVYSLLKQDPPASSS